MRKKSRGNALNEFAGGRLAVAVARHPREAVGLLMASGAMLWIFVNALFLQHGPHPAPIFAARSLPSLQQPTVLPRPRASVPAAIPVVRPAAQIIADIQRELGRKSFYDGAADGVWGAKTDEAARAFVQAAGLKITVEASESLLQAIVSSKLQRNRAVPPPHYDPIAELIAPTQQVAAVQRALSDFGYGQIKPTGVYDPATRAAIEKFERDRRLPVTGQISEQVVRELAALTGRPLE